MGEKNVQKETVSAFSILPSPLQVIKCDMNMMKYIVQKMFSQVFDSQCCWLSPWKQYDS